MGKYVGFCMRRTSLGLTTSGLEHLPSDRPCLFISNHRDIVLDSAIVVVTLGSQDVPNMQIAIGDNLFESGWEKEIMRLNRGFMVVRQAGSRRAQYEALVTTSKIHSPYPGTRGVRMDLATARTIERWSGQDRSCTNQNAVVGLS